MATRWVTGQKSAEVIVLRLRTGELEYARLNWGAGVRISRLPDCALVRHEMRRSYVAWFPIQNQIMAFSVRVPSARY